MVCLTMALTFDVDPHIQFMEKDLGDEGQQSQVHFEEEATKKLKKKPVKK
jgi:hypothetical protein